MKLWRGIKEGGGRGNENMIVTEGSGAAMGTAHHTNAVNRIRVSVERDLKVEAEKKKRKNLNLQVEKVVCSKYIRWVLKIKHNNASLKI